MERPVIYPKFPFSGQKSLLQNLVVEYFQIVAGDFASPHFANKGAG
jgi:hypothetical protein